jgi:hypothetical protein
MIEQLHKAIEPILILTTTIFTISLRDIGGGVQVGKVEFNLSSNTLS